MSSIKEKGKVLVASIVKEKRKRTAKAVIKGDLRFKKAVKTPIRMIENKKKPIELIIGLAK